jgi:hypothetical protein
MHPAITGAIIGGVIGVLLIVFEYMMLSNAVNERAKKLNRKAEFDVTERRRIATITRFALILPIGFGIGWWLLSGLV